eukprot:CAMPEP_0174305020 /NCGR_PEP_ID=MMETSP0809-20121228/61160_1 /TAXON_ID=73025 ORGANISM="Eutreptiella gymnastica-like, Strain CCMP1594" /NCGR_SAMPLE_ID=MMETSP0809 /ASSEMBLY_ACC=CAM_ASM_000658 /LENGTH=87 /DNA_ID=CAMNT_0015411411 /DNA_START=576 /DNA_END=836 /DNA_ORIENTATION=+
MRGTPLDTVRGAKCLYDRSYWTSVDASVCCGYKPGVWAVEDGSGEGHATGGVMFVMDMQHGFWSPGHKCAKCNVPEHPLGMVARLKW